MSTITYKSFNQLSFTDILVYSKLPDHPFWSQVGSKIDFSFADSLFSFLYSGRGPRPYAPSLKLKIHLVQAYYHLTDRGVEEKVIGDLFIKRFLGLPVEFFGFDHSTIALDRDRMGLSLFHSCHLYILAQMHQLGLWGDKGEQWIIDSFPSASSVAFHGALPLIQQGILRLVRHLERFHPTLHALLDQQFPSDQRIISIPKDASSVQRMVAFSQQVVQAYALLNWFESPLVAPLFWAWSRPDAQLRSLELQALLIQVLQDTSLPSPPDDAPPPPSRSEERSSPSADVPSSPLLATESEVVVETGKSSGSSAPSAVQEQPVSVDYVKIPFQRRPFKIISLDDPEARIGKKGALTLLGYKIQNLCSSQGVVLNVRVIPASEHDSQAAVDLVKEIVELLGYGPDWLLGDSAYGSGSIRQQLQDVVQVHAPVPASNQPKGLWDASHFQYDPERDTYRCPEGHESVRQSRSHDTQGKQYGFSKHACAACPQREACTTAKGGRTVFRSDYHDLYQKANTAFTSEEGQERYKTRTVVERVNQALKNPGGLGKPRTKGKRPLGIKATLAAIVTNLKYTVRQLIHPKPGFIRRPT
ncbi:transposase [Paenibacillus sp. YN15]|uniref:transposase n=1 Tax=Paenibacillus sp. YN15 TaxID=1742774 RepID=UPI000DCD8F93|nr:transposase [Paenibacillus sp. YN15]RAV01223.1 DDE transposase [Paenibacillus sp. YN15]